jgi:hypothetical protein
MWYSIVFVVNTYPRSAAMPELSPIPPVPEKQGHRWGCAIGCGSLALVGIIGGGMMLANTLNEGNDTPRSAATSDPFERGPASPTPESTLDEATPQETVDTDTAEPNNTPEETEASDQEPTKEPTVDAPATQAPNNSGENDYSSCPWTESNPQTPDSNGNVKVWSACGAPGLAAYEYPSVTRVDIKDGTNVKAVCKWEDGGDYLGTNYNDKPTFVLAPDLGYVSVGKSCQDPRK